MTELKCPFKFGHYEFEGGEDCIGAECGMHNLCNAETEITAAEFDALDEHAQALERENEELRAKVDELTERNCPGYEPENHYCRYHAQDFELNHTTVSKLKRENAELQKQVDDLTSERDKLRDKVRHQSRQLTDTQNALENRNEEIKPRWKRDTKKLQNKIDELTAELTAARNAHAQAEHEAATLRDKMGRMLDNAHEITRIGGDC